MDRAEGLTHRPPRPLNHTTNGHAPASEQISASDYPSPFTSEDEDLNQQSGKSTSRRSTSSNNNKKKDKGIHRLRFYTPQQLIDNVQRKVENHLFIHLLILRLITALITSFTVFAPDEHWQSLEIAHRIIFGYGYTTWEWRDARKFDHLDTNWGRGPIRSPLYPLVFAIPYGLLKITKLDETILLTILPSLMQALMAAATDLYTFKLARKLLNDQAAWITLIPTIISAYTFHTSTRTLSNSAEATFTIMAFYYWPLSLPQDSDHDLVGDMPLIKASDMEKSLIFFAMSSILRPSNVLLSIPLLIFLILRILRNIKSAATALESAFALIFVGRACLVVGLVATSLLTLMDSIYYGRLTLTPLAFLKRNVFEGISIFYGSSPLHFYFTSALPSICFTMLPFTLYGILMAIRAPNLDGFDRDNRKWYGSRGENDPIGLRVMTQVIIIFITCMSFLKHKETRFLQPITPLLNILIGYALGLLPSLQATMERFKKTPLSNRYETEQNTIWRRGKVEREKRHELLESLSMHRSSHNRRHILKSSSISSSGSIISKLKTAWKDVSTQHGRLAILLLVLQIPPIIYLSFHSAGQVAVVRDIGKLSRSGQLNSVDFLMPCHSTPWMSHMHDKRLSLDGNARFITCEPPLDGQDISVYMDESDYFYQDPYAFILKRFTEKRPSHLVLFEALLHQSDKNNQEEKSSVAYLLAENGYTIIQSYWNSFFHLDYRRRGRILLYQRGRGS